MLPLLGLIIPIPLLPKLHNIFQLHTSPPINRRQTNNITFHLTQLIPNIRLQFLNIIPLIHPHITPLNPINYQLSLQLYYLLQKVTIFTLMLGTQML